MNDRYICYIGRPSYQKNTFFFVDVVEKVHRVQPDLKFYLLGVGYYSPDLERLKVAIISKGLENVITLMPWLSHAETLKYVKGAQIYLTTAIYEGLPLAVIEAMSLGKAIVASNVIGNKDCVDQGRNGFLVQADDADGFAEKINILLDNFELRKYMEHQSRKLFEERFLINRRICELKRIYRLIGGGKSFVVVYNLHVAQAERRWAA